MSLPDVLLQDWRPLLVRERHPTVLLQQGAAGRDEEDNLGSGTKSIFMGQQHNTGVSWLFCSTQLETSALTPSAKSPFGLVLDGFDLKTVHKLIGKEKRFNMNLNPGLLGEKRE